MNQPGYLAPMGLQKSLPGKRTVRCGLDPIVLEHFAYRAGGYLVSKLFEFSLDPTISPARVFQGHPYDQGGNPFHEPRPADPLSFAGPLERNQATVPSHD